MSVRKAQTDYFSPMTGNVFRDNRRQADLIMDTARTQMERTNNPYRRYGSEDSASISDTFDQNYGVISDEKAAEELLKKTVKKVEEQTPEPTPEPTPKVTTKVTPKVTTKVAQDPKPTFTTYQTTKPDIVFTNKSGQFRFAKKEAN